MMDDANLVRYLGSAEDGHELLLRSFQGAAKVVELFLHQQTSRRLRNEMGDALGRGVGAVSATEGVIHVDIAKSRELTSEVRIVRFFSRVEAQVLEQEDLA